MTLFGARYLTSILILTSKLLSMAHWITPIGNPDGKPHDVAYNGAKDSTPLPPTCNPAINLAEMQCQGTGFITCDYSGWVYRDCGPGTVCHPGNPLFCGF